MFRKFYNKKTLAAASFMAMLFAGAAITKPANGPRNLKVLPKDISEQKLDSIMHSYNKALGVDCKFCHDANSPSLVFGQQPSIDFSSDKNPMKENAREMMRMTIDINKRYFYFDTTQRPEYLHTITCKNCHQGNPIPPED